MNTICPYCGTPCRSLLEHSLASAECAGLALAALELLGPVIGPRVHGSAALYFEALRRARAVVNYHKGDIDGLIDPRN